MSTRVPFGRTALEVSPVCFGTWQLSPRFWGEQPEADLIAAMRAGFDAGVNFFDTADAYGDGLAETVLGKVLRDLPRDELVICTKVFNHFKPDASRYPDLSADYIAARCDIQLKRMGIETIDLYLLHMYDPLTPLDEVTETLERLKAQGKIRRYGTSNFTTEQMHAVEWFGAYDACQPPYSLLAPDIERDLLPHCQAANIGVMVYSPLHKGLLSGKYTGDETFDDFRQYHADFTGERFRTVAQAVRGLAPLADQYGLSIYQLVLTATLMHPGIHVAVVGIKTPTQIVEAAAVMGKQLSREDYFEVRKALTIKPPKIKDARAQVK